MREAQARGYRARSVFKLSEVDRKHRLISPACQIVDLGAAPGGWSEYAISKLSGAGRIVGVDLLEIRPIQGVHAIQGDFTDPAVQRNILEHFAEQSLDLVLSDMSPNISGIATVDQAQAENIQISILEFCQKALKPGGNVLTKLFAGSATGEIRMRFEQQFRHVQMIKPDASRSKSKEVYLLARGHVPARIGVEN